MLRQNARGSHFAVGTHSNGFSRVATLFSYLVVVVASCFAMPGRRMAYSIPPAERTAVQVARVARDKRFRSAHSASGKRFLEMDDADRPAAKAMLKGRATHRALAEMVKEKVEVPPHTLVGANNAALDLGLIDKATHAANARYNKLANEYKHNPTLGEVAASASGLVLTAPPVTKHVAWADMGEEPSTGDAATGASLGVLSLPTTQRGVSGILSSASAAEHLQNNYDILEKTLRVPIIADGPMGGFSAPAGPAAFTIGDGDDVEFDGGVYGPDVDWVNPPMRLNDRIARGARGAVGVLLFVLSTLAAQGAPRRQRAPTLAALPVLVVLYTILGGGLFAGAGMLVPQPVVTPSSMVSLAPTMVASCPMFAVANVFMAQQGLTNPYQERCMENGPFRCCYTLVGEGIDSSSIAYHSAISVYGPRDTAVVSAGLPIDRSLSR